MTKTIHQTDKASIAVIILDEDVKMSASTRKIVSPFVTAAISCGAMATFVKITPAIWSELWGNKPLKSLKSGLTNTRKKTIS
jgi:hypothetical protein